MLLPYSCEWYRLRDVFLLSLFGVCICSTTSPTPLTKLTRNFENNNSLTRTNTKATCGSNLIIVPNARVIVKRGIRGTHFHNPSQTLQGCCDACEKAGVTGCEAFLTGTLFHLCVLYPAGSVIGADKNAPNHTAVFRGSVPPPPMPPGGSLDQKLVVLSQSEADAYGAKCLDGSPPAIYYAPARGAENQNNWVLYFKGGGWCFDETSCAKRSKTILGTSTILPTFVNETWDKTSGPLHPSTTLNPTFANFHRVILWYCDGASFAGAVERPIHNEANGTSVTMYFRGRAVLDALLGKLKKDYGLGKAQQVLLTGCSAGGMRTYLHADYVKTQVVNAALTRYKVAPLSGFFLDHKTATGQPVAREQYDYMFQMQNMTGGVNQACIKATRANDGTVNCSTPQQNYAYISQPIFVMNSMLDAYQMANILNVGCSPLHNCNSSQLAIMEQYQRDFYAAITSFSTYRKGGNGAFLYNCDMHCAEQDWNGFNQIAVRLQSKGTAVIMQEALSMWWNSDVSSPATAHTYAETCTLDGPRACNPTCPANTDILDAPDDAHIWD